MAQRHKARECALQMLFQWEIGRQELERIERGFWQIVGADKNMRSFADQLFEGAARNAAEIDGEVAALAEHWRPERFAVIDRVILRLAAFELSAKKTPAKVVLNEAVELAKKFSSEDAASFINGILDALVRSGEKKAEGKGTSSKKQKQT